jgi:general secretion pathway protein C
LRIIKKIVRECFVIYPVLPATVRIYNNMPASSSQGFSSNLSGLEARLKPLQQFVTRVPLVVWQRLVRLLLVIWLAYVAAQLFWALMPIPKIPTASVSAESFAGSQTTAIKVGVDINSLKALTPFGNPVVAPVTTTPETGIEQEAAETQLNLTLRGLVYSNDEKVARAVIATSDKQDVYAVGDPIPMGNNVTVAKILSDRVILSNNGKYESLWLFKDDPNTRSRVGTSPGRSVDRSVSRPVPVHYESENNESYVEGPPPIIEQNNISRMGNTLSDVVAMSIHRENGQIVGYKIRPGRNAEMFNSLGLQADDVVTAVNGMPLDNPGKIMEIYRSMGTATSANLQILRNGSTVNLDISLNQ